MAKIGSRQKSKKRYLAVAALEHEAAVQEFAHAMRLADLGYITSHVYSSTANAPFPLTVHMQNAMTRYIHACHKLKALNA